MPAQRKNKEEESSRTKKGPRAPFLNHRKLLFEVYKLEPEPVPEPEPEPDAATGALPADTAVVKSFLAAVRAVELGAEFTAPMVSPKVVAKPDRELFKVFTAAKLLIVPTVIPPVAETVDTGTEAARASNIVRAEPVAVAPN